MKQLLRQMLVLILVGVRRSQLMPDAVRQLESGEEGVQLFLVAQAFLGVEESQQGFCCSRVSVSCSVS